MQDVVIGIDGGLTNFGISMLGIETNDHATLLYKPKKKGAERLNELFNFVTEVVTLTERRFFLQHIAMEGYAPGVKGKQYTIGEGGGAVKLALVRYLGVDDIRAYPTIVTPTSLKKFVYGKGQADKNLMLLSVYRKWGVEFSNDDQCDAYSLARIASAVLSGQTEHGYEAEVVNALERHTEWPGTSP